MILVVFILICLLIILFVSNRIYMIRYIKNERKKLREIQQHLFGYVGESSEEKKEELYKKYLEVNKNLI